MKKLILINGNGGVGKATTAQLLYSKLPDSAWIHMRWLLAYKAWQPNKKSSRLGITNAAAVINNYFAEGVVQVIHSGNVQDQEDLDYLQSLITVEHQTFYFWLDAADDVRYDRLVKRARDEGDKPESARKLISRYSVDPGNLMIREGLYQRIETSLKEPEEIVNEMISCMS